MDNVVALLAAFRGEHLVLQEGIGAEFFSFPQEYVGLVSTRADSEEDAPEKLHRLKWKLEYGTRAEILKPQYVGRFFVKMENGTYQLQVVFTCIMTGYFDGIGVKLDAIPKNFYPGHATALEYVRYFWERDQERGSR